eukprot:CAMPEP_0176502384 /NCGR_PEP_ID=MMETSP0200_2-20121128/14720_1 /TAXON_ID=947934 /ORGANISM="Chaetoceros sp., Strain GSL56" /LENGTH=1764 /DNA_ID=CAMNT_0017901443 /DNA_START=340 /DNA_END=5631 /DNA_ORIENTATION=-
MMDDSNLVMEEECDEGDFDDDEMNGMCTQGQQDGAFMFGSEAGLFTQAIDSDSDNVEDYDEDNAIIPRDVHANDFSRDLVTHTNQDDTNAVGVEKEAVDSMYHCSDATLLCGESPEDVEDRSDLPNEPPAEDQKSDGDALKHQNITSTTESEGNILVIEESELPERQSHNVAEMNLQGFTESTQMQDEHTSQDNIPRDNTYPYAVEGCEKMNSTDRRDGRASPIENNKQPSTRGEGVQEKMTPTQSFWIDDHSCPNTNDNAIHSGFTESTQTQEKNLDLENEDTSSNIIEKCVVFTGDRGNINNNVLADEKMDDVSDMSKGNPKACTHDHDDVSMGKDTAAKQYSATTKNRNGEDLDVQMEEDLPRIERRGGNMLSIFAGDTQSIPSQLVLTMDENKRDHPPPSDFKPSEILASVEQNDEVEPESFDAKNDARYSNSSIVNDGAVLQPTKHVDPLTFSHDTNDSFYGGSTEKLSNSLPTRFIENNLYEAKHDDEVGKKCSPPNKDKREKFSPSSSDKGHSMPPAPSSEVLAISDMNNVDAVNGNSHVQKRQTNNSVNHSFKLHNETEAPNPGNEVLYESIINPTNTPIEDHLSYPKDYLYDEVMLKNSTSTKHTLSTTPQSQILLEPISMKKFQFSVINKVVGPGETQGTTCNDTVAYTSDEDTDNEVTNDSTQLDTTTPNSETFPSEHLVSREVPDPSPGNFATRDSMSKISNDASDSETDGEEDHFPDTKRRECNASSLDDTQPEDEDNKPLINLRRVKRGRVLSRKENGKPTTKSNGSSDEGQQFLDDVYEPQSQNTRDIKYQLLKLEQYDIKEMAKKLLQAPVATHKVSEEKIEALTAKCNLLETRNKELVREKSLIMKELTAVKCQLKEKNALIAEMKQKLDEYQPLLDAVHKLNMKSQLRDVNDTPSPKNSSKNHSKQESRKTIETIEKASLGDNYSTPNQKSLNKKNEANVVSVSIHKRKRKNVTGNMTFSNLWKLLKKHGWSYRNAPMPLAGQVYVPPGGSVKMGAVAGVDFFEANHLLWEKAEELGIIDGDSQDEEIERVIVKNSTPISKSREKDLLPGTSNQQATEFNNTELVGKDGSLTEMSVYYCASVIKDFLQLGSEGHFMRNLFTPMWTCISDDQGSTDKELAWRYCKSKGAGNLGRDYWFCPPNSKGSKGVFGIDYFTTEEAVVCQIVREIKKHGVNPCTDEEIDGLEIKLSRAIEQHIPFDEIKNSASSAHTKRPHRRTTSTEPIRSLISVSSSKGAKNSLIQQSLSNNTPSKSTDKIQNVAVSKAVTFSLTAAYAVDSKIEISPKYDNMATASGIKKLIHLRKQSQIKCKLKDHEIEGPRKRLKLSPSAICHLTQNPDDEHSVEPVFNPPRWIKRSLSKDLPLCGLLFFGSGVDERVRYLWVLLLLTSDKKNNFLLTLSSLRLCPDMSAINVNRRRTHKYILACALGVPMLNFEWLFELEEKFNEYKGDRQTLPSAFDSHLFSKYRLPSGLSSATGLFPLQKARHAKYWNRPGSENGSLLFEGMNIMIALEDYESEKKWTDIIQSIGATVVSHNDIGKKGIKLDTIIVDSVNMPPHVTAVPLRVGKVLSKAASYQPNAVIVDLSWANQCIVQRKILQTDDDRRYRVDMSKGKSPYREQVVDVYSIKVNQFNGLTRYEVGDTVNFARNGDELSQGRITAIKFNTKTRTNTVEVKVLERNNVCELMDGGKGICSVTIDEKALQGHIVILAGKDYCEVANTKTRTNTVEVKVLERNNVYELMDGGKGIYS